MKTSYGLGWLALLLLFAVLLCGCGGEEGPVLHQPSQPGVQYQAPPFQDVRFDQTQAIEALTGVWVDLSAARQGYIAVMVSASQQERLKLIIKKTGEQEEEYRYSLPNNDQPTFFPLSKGSGTYEITLYQMIPDTTHGFAVWPAQPDTPPYLLEVTLEDEFQPFLRPSVMVNYRQSSACVAKAAELAQSCSTDLDVVAEVYDFVVGHVTYDYEKLAAVTKEYESDPDETLATGRGICGDYSCLVAAMLRSQGIPCQMVYGDVVTRNGSERHEWNRIYIQNEGWITVGIKNDGSGWTRVDTTFAATGVEPADLQKDERYTRLKTY